MTSQITITNAGITAPQASDIKEAFQEVFTNAFGTDLSLDDSTPQGSMIDDFTLMKQTSNTNDLYLFNQMNPETAEGVFQDALGSIYGLKRKDATHSIVNCECIGVQGTVIDTTAMAQNTNGDLFQAIETKTIPESGTITVQFQSVETGIIPVGANTVNKIYSVIIGWDSVNNSVAGTEGTERESRIDFEARRKKELSRNARGTLGAVLSAVWEVDGVSDISIEQNRTSANKTIRGITLSPHSIYLCVNGGLADDIAQAIFYSLSGGCDTTATSTSVVGSYTDPYSNVQDTYNIDRPTNVPISVKIGIMASVSEEIEEQIKNAIISDWQGQTDNESITIGSSVYASQFYTDISRLSINNLQLVNVKVSKDGGSTWEDVLTFNLNELPTIENSNITFEVV